MKVILSLSLLGLIYLGSTLGINNHLDISGNYYPISSNLKISESLFFKPDETFEYSQLLLKGNGQQTIIRGKYTTKGNEISLIILETESISTLIDSSNNQPSIPIKNRTFQDGKIDSKISPERFKKMQTAFESGSLKLKPKYFVKLSKGKLSLCQKDIRKDQFNPVLIKK